MNINITTKIDSSKLVGLVILKVLKYKKITLSEKERDDIVNMISNDKEIIEELNKMATITVEK